MSTNSTDGARVARPRLRLQAATMRVPATPADVDRGCRGPKSCPRARTPPRCWAAARACGWPIPTAARARTCCCSAPTRSWERLNVADTVKVPWQAYLGAGHPLLSDQGRVLATVVADTLGPPRHVVRHDGRGPAPRCCSAATSTAWTFATSPRRCRCSRASGSATTARWASPGRPGAGAAVDLLIHLPVVVVAGQRGPPARPEPRASPTSTCWPGGPATSSRTPVNDDPEYLRALFNTESTWAAARNSEATA